MPFIDQYLPWTDGENDSKVLSALQGDEMFIYFSEEFAKVKFKNFDFSRSEISKYLPKRNAIDKLLMQKFESSAKDRLQAFKNTFKTYHKEFLHKIDRESLVEFLFFNILVKNADWALFALNSHGSGYRNVKFFRSPSGKMIAVPYDFDQSSFTRDKLDQFITKDDYIRSLDTLTETLKIRFDGFLNEDLIRFSATFVKKIKESEKKEWPDNFQKNMQTFADVLETYFK